MIINEKITHTVSSLIGEFDIIKDHRNRSKRTGVLEIKTNNKRIFVKIYNRLSRWSSEVYAYKNWTYIFEEYAPILIHSFCDDNTYGIITTPIHGKTINEYQINDESVLEVAYYKAGELLKQLHDNFEGTYFGIPATDGSPLEDNSVVNPVYYINFTLESILKSGYDKGLLDNSDKKLFEWCIKNSDVFKSSKPAPTNWDFSQNNWMVDRNGKFTGFIDFENMLWGIDVDSFGVVIERYTQNRPRLKNALFERYGLDNGLEKQLQLKIISVKMAIADITYGASIGDNRFFSLGRKLIESLTMILRV